MRLPQRLQWMAYVLAPLVLVIGVAIQRYNVIVHDQTPWAGGGFGMFSSVDVPGARMTRAYVLTDQGPALIPDAPFPVSGRLIYTQPTEERLDQMAQHLAAQEWRVFGEDAFEEIEPYLPDYMQRYLRSREAQDEFLGGESEDYPRAVAFVARRTPPRSVPDEVAIEGTRVEVWRPLFDRATNTLSWELIQARTAPIPSVSSAE